MNYYVYFHINPITKEVFYVGKGKDKRAYGKNKRNQFWYNTVNKYGEPIVVIVKKNLSNKYALELEKAYIKIFGRRDLNEGCLVNLTNGGEGTVGVIYSKESIKKMSDSKLGKIFSNETKQKMSESAKNRGSNRDGKLHSNETKQKMSESAKKRRKYKWITNEIIDTTIDINDPIPEGFRKGRKKIKKQ